MDREPVLGRESQDSVLLLLSSVLSALCYFGYVISIRSVQNAPLTIEELRSPSMVLYFLVVSISTVIVVSAWRRGAWVGSSLSVGGFLLWPWVYSSVPIGGVGEVAIPFAVCLVCTSAGLLLRVPDSSTDFFRRLGGKAGLAVGGGHLLVGLVLQRISRRFVGLGYTFPNDVVMIAVYTVSALALVGIGAFVVASWRSLGLRSPAVLGGGWLLCGILRTWQLRERFSFGESQPIGWISPVPAPDYMLNWIVLLLGLVVVTTVELTVQRVQDRLRGVNTA